MQRRAAAQLQMNGAICLVTRGQRERLQPNCTWSPVLTPARRFPLQGKKQKNRREGEREKQILPHQALLQSLQSPSHFPSSRSPAALSAGFDTSICFSFWPFNVLSVSACKPWADVWGQFLAVPLVSEWLRTLYIWGGLPPCHLLNISLFALLEIEAEKLRGRNKKSGWGGDSGAHSQQPLGNRPALYQSGELSPQARPDQSHLRNTYLNKHQHQCDRLLCKGCFTGNWHSLEYWSHILTSNPNVPKNLAMSKKERKKVNLLLKVNLLEKFCFQVYTCKITVTLYFRVS